MIVGHIHIHLREILHLPTFSNSFLPTHRCFPRAYRCLASVSHWQDPDDGSVSRWPVLWLYPEHNQLDATSGAGLDDMLAEHLVCVCNTCLCAVLVCVQECASVCKCVQVFASACKCVQVCMPGCLFAVALRLRCGGARVICCSVVFRLSHTRLVLVDAASTLLCDP